MAPHRLRALVLLLCLLDFIPGICVKRSGLIGRALDWGSKGC